jgi:hypothetical protein
MSQLQQIRIADYIRRQNPFVADTRPGPWLLRLQGFVAGIVSMIVVAYLLFGVVSK